MKPSASFCATRRATRRRPSTRVRQLAGQSALLRRRFGGQARKWAQRERAQRRSAPDPQARELAGPDRAAWDRLFVEGDILDGVGPCHHWAEGSRKKREQTYGHWLGFCAGREMALSTARRDGARERRDGEGLYRARPRPLLAAHRVHARRGSLCSYFRSMAPQKDWKWLARIVGRMRGGLEGEELKPRLGIEATDILRLGAEADGGD